MKKMLKAVDAKRLGSIPAVFALGANDIAIATLDTGEQIYCSWGWNLTKDDKRFKSLSQDKFLFHLIEFPNGKYEVEILQHHAELLVPILLM